MSTKAQKIDAMIRPALEDMGFDLVQVIISGSDRRPVLQIMAEKSDDAADNENRRITIDDCQTISKTVSALLDVEDPIKNAYTLEVGSPGIDRPLVKLSDFKRFEGHEVKIEAPLVIEDRKRYQGDIIKVSDDEVIHISGKDDEIFELPFDKIQKAKLVLTDKLLNAYKNKEL